MKTNKYKTDIETDTLSIQILEDVQELFEDESHWTQNVLSRDAENHETDPLAKDSTCWCLLGAVIKCSAEHYQPDRLIKIFVYRALEIKAKELFNTGIVHRVNDDPTMALPAVRKLIRKTIQELEGEAA